MGNPLQKLRRALRLGYNFLFTNKRRTLTARIVLLSALYRLKIRFFPMARLQNTFGEMGKESPYEELPENLYYAWIIHRRVERVCQKTAWDSKCLVQGLTAQRLLARKDIHTTLYLGLRQEDGAMHAHAWLRCGPLYVTGGSGEEHTVVSMFYR